MSKFRIKVARSCEACDGKGKILRHEVVGGSEPCCACTDGWREELMTPGELALAIESSDRFEVVTGVTHESDGAGYALKARVHTVDGEKHTVRSARSRSPRQRSVVTRSFCAGPSTRARAAATCSTRATS